METALTPLALYSNDFEQQLLGCLLISPDSFSEVRGLVSGEMFYLHKHRWIFDAITALRESGASCDVTTLAEELRRGGNLEGAGGMFYLNGLINTVPSSLNITSYGRIVHRDYLRRLTLAAAQAIATLAYSESISTDELIRQSQSEIRSIASAGHAARETLRPAHELVSYLFDVLDDPMALRAERMPTGLVALDAALGGGLRKKTATIIMARPGMGKSAALEQIADNVARAGGVVAVFSKEMSEEEWNLRTVFRRARVDSRAYEGGRCSDEEVKRVSEQLTAISERKTLFIDESTPQTTEQVWSLCDKLAEQAGEISLIIGDHMRLFSDAADNETHRMGKISWAFKEIAKNLNARVLIACQLSRQVERQADKVPDLKDLRDSGEIEENADNVIALYRDTYYSNNASNKKAEFWIRKARGGVRNAKATMIYLPEFTSFENMAGGLG